MGSSTSSNRGGSTPFFTSPKASSLTPAQSGTTPFASLSEMPFTESEGALTVEAQSQSQPQSHAYTQPLPPPASQKKQAQTSMDSQVWLLRSASSLHSQTLCWQSHALLHCDLSQHAAMRDAIDLAAADRPDQSWARFLLSFSCQESGSIVCSGTVGSSHVSVLPSCHRSLVLPYG